MGFGQYGKVVRIGPQHGAESVDFSRLHQPYFSSIPAFKGGTRTPDHFQRVQTPLAYGDPQPTVIQASAQTPVDDSLHVTERVFVRDRPKTP